MKFIAFKEPALYNFQLGYIAGVLVVLALFVAAVLLIFWWRRKRCREIDIPGENGSLFISEKAIFGLVKGKVSEVNGIRCSGLRLSRGRDGVVLSIRLGLDPGVRELPVLVENLRTTLFTELKGVFGITDIRKIDINVY